MWSIWGNKYKISHNKKKQEQLLITEGERTNLDAHLYENRQMSSEIQRDKSDVSDNKLIVVFHIENKITLIKAFTFIKAFTTNNVSVECGKNWYLGGPGTILQVLLI